MVAFSAAPLKLCPPFHTSPQVLDPTLDMAMIQTGAPPFDELLWFRKKKQKEEKGEGIRVSRTKAL